MSLRSLVQKGRFYCDWAKTAEQLERLRGSCSFLMERAHDRTTMPVNAQSVWDDMIRPGEKVGESAWERLVNYKAIPRPKPPYERMWLETHMDNPFRRFAAVVSRFELLGCPEVWLTLFDPEEQQMIVEDNPTTIVVASLIQEYRGGVFVGGRCDYWLDADGNFMGSAQVWRFPDEPSGEIKEQMETALKVVQGWILHTFARMNCANARLVEMPGGFSPKRASRHQHAPYSVWHQIQISDAPKIRRAARAAEGEDSDSVRFHWVRGHYADYTKGAGLFGNPKLRAVFWIPEYCAGKEELGSVAADYQVK